MFPTPKPKSKLQVAIDEVLFQMESHPADSEEYAAMLNHVQVLHKMKEAEKPSRVSPDTLVLAATNILGIALIIRHEQFNNITSNALSFVNKAR
jgi:hypothetical protein